MRAAHPVRSTEAARTRPNRRFIDTLDPPIYLSIIVPTYEYQCEKCQRVFEIRQRITEPALTICEVCGGHVKRLLSPAPFILKGEGWYVTDYPSESRKKAREAEKPAANGSGKGSDKGSDNGSDKGTAAKASARIEVTRLPKRSTWSTVPATAPCASRTLDQCRRTGSSTGGPSRSGARPSARCAAAGANTSRPWNVRLTERRR